MVPEHLHFGGGGGTSVSPISFVLVILAGLLVLFLSRRNAIFPFLIGGFLIPYGQLVTIAGLHFQMLRVLMIFAFVRMLWDGIARRKEQPVFELHGVDRAFIYFTIVSTIAFMFLNPEMAAFTNQLGVLYNAFGLYFFLRFLIRDEEDVARALKSFTVVAAVAAVFMIIEQFTSRNLFGLLGGVPFITPVREGRIRSQAFFGHSIIAGCYGATLAPVCLWLWLKGGQLKKWAVIGFVSATLMTLASASSTPIMAYTAGILGFGFWPLRRHMRWVRRIVVVSLIFLHMIMKGPVWALIDHIDIIGGNSANHRYALVDLCIRHFWDWWLVGTNDNANWGWDMWDTANTYVSVAEGGGLLTLLLFLMMIQRAFRSVGRARKILEPDRKKELLVFTFGVGLFTHCVAFFGIAYFDQTIIAWYGLLAMIIAGTAAYGVAPVPQTVRAMDVSNVRLSARTWLDTRKPAATKSYAPRLRRDIE
jgi:hypothetical protein